MVKFFKWLGSKISAAQRENEIGSKGVNDVLHNTPDNPQDLNPLNLRIYKATGGAVLEFRRYDEKRDRHEYEMYNNPESDDFCERMAQHIQMEYLKGA